ncbi:NADH-dependent flavin oxidoreductase [Paenibacillus elgii]|uniref:oxidoreductase n=1 Tax=Paenibacillus elgii TaxID=189691 RepID=UPI000248C895|nr:NADH-dependent flavin oxidoreductase [Paenibacillus elgii]
MNPAYRPLFQPFTFHNGLQVNKRIVMAPMTNWSSNPEGFVTDEEILYYERRSGQVGKVVTACAYVTAIGKGFRGEIAADRDATIPSLRRLASAIQEKGSKAVLQIFHGGSECPVDLVPIGDDVSAGNVPSVQNPSVMPRPLSDEEFSRLVEALCAKELDYIHVRTAEDALKAYETGIPLIALGRELLVEPDWVRKIQEGNDSDIEITLKTDAQERLVIPDPMWKTIMNSPPGWLPIES